MHGDKESAYSKYMGDAIFKVPTPLMLDKIVTAMDGIYEQMSQLKTADTRGDIYEYLLSKIATAGVNGQFRTPRHIIRMMVDLMEPKADEVVCDPACGTSGFLVAVSDYLKENRKQEVFFNRHNKDHYMNHMFHGFDMDRTMLRIGAMNMMTHGVDNPFIEYRDSLSDQNPDKENDIPDIIERFHHLENEEDRERTQQSFFVPKQEIIDNEYDLSINKYKKTEYVPVEYPPTSEIMAQLREIEKQIAVEMDELEKLLKEGNADE